MAELTGDKWTVVKTPGDELTVAENARNVDMLAGGLGFIEEAAGEVPQQLPCDLLLVEGTVPSP